MIGYKIVVKLNNKDLTSATIPYPYNHCYIYKQHKWTKRKKRTGPMAVFENEEDAIWFSHWFFTFQIWRCKYIKSKTKYLYYYDTNSTDNAKVFADKISCPPGTVFADKVMLLERVK